jgi:hypothetical protein
VSTTWHPTWHSPEQLSGLVHRLERDVVRGVDRAADFLLSPLTIDFRGWTFGDQRNETWM